MAQRKRLELELPCILSEEELVFRSQMLVETVSAKDETSRARTESAKWFKDKIVGLDEKQRDLARILRTGIEDRMVQCVVEFHVPTCATRRNCRLMTRSRQRTPSREFPND